MDHSDVLVIGVEDVVWGPDWLPVRELDAECTLACSWVELLSLTLDAISWSKGSILLEVSLRVIDSDETIVSSGVDCHDALTVFLGLSIGSVELIPRTKELVSVEVLLN